MCPRKPSEEGSRSSLELYAALLSLFLWSIAEMAIVPVPAEIVVVPLVAAANLNPLIVAIVGSLGSSIGGMIDYVTGEKAFSYLDSRFQIALRVSKVEKRFRRIEKYGLPGLIAIGRLFPFASLKPIMFFAGCVKYDRRTYLSIIVGSSFVRYLVAATIGSLLAYLIARL